MGHVPPFRRISNQVSKGGMQHGLTQLDTRMGATLKKAGTMYRLSLDLKAALRLQIKAISSDTLSDPE